MAHTPSRGKFHTYTKTDKKPKPIKKPKKNKKPQNKKNK